MASAMIVPAMGRVARADTQTLEELSKLSIEDLGNIEITSVSKEPQRLSDAAASVFVITHDDIIRSGATTIPEMLRLAPNLEVAQVNASTYAISARGFNVGNNASMSDKLLVLIDGRTIYTPLFAGVYWDMQGVLPENIDRIEVISGPAGTLYGANAVNGVINIITRNSVDTQGGYAEANYGNVQHGAAVQYGGQIDNGLTYRAYADDERVGPDRLAGGGNAQDIYSRPQGGFRMDWAQPKDAVTLQGSDFQGSEEPNGTIIGRFLSANWSHQLADSSSVEAQAYYDNEQRLSEYNVSGGFSVDTYDVSLQHDFALGDWNKVIWGGGNRVVDYDIYNTASLLFDPSHRSLDQGDLFVQDTASLTRSLDLILGLKIENEPYTGPESLPTARLAWKATNNILVWTAVSRAVRSDTPVDRDLIEKIGSTPILDKSFNFQPETLVAYEAGTRIEPMPGTSLSVSSYYDRYDDLRSLELSSGGLPLRWGNGYQANVLGVEAWGSYAVTDWWKLGAGFNLQHEDIHTRPGSVDLGGVSFISDDPNHQAQLRSSFDLGSGVTLDAMLRNIGELHTPFVAEYTELNARLGWTVTQRFEVSLSGFNLIHPEHVEFNEAGSSNEIPRSYLAEVRVRF